MTIKRIAEQNKPATIITNKNKLLEKLDNTEQKLASVSRKLEEKNYIINGLRADLEHAIEQIALLQNKNHLPVGKSKWIADPLPGING